MFSCIKYKRGKDKGEENNENRQSGNPNKPKDSSKSITRQLKGLALKVSGGLSSSRQNKASKGSTDQRRRNSESEIDDLSELQNIGITEEGSYDEINYSPPPPSPDPAGLFIIGVPNLSPNPSIGGGSHYHHSSVNTNVATAAFPEWLAHVEEGVSIAFVSLSTTGGNDLRRIQFSRRMFDPELAQSWWTTNHERIMAFYNVKSFNEAVIPRHHEWSSMLTFGEEGGGYGAFFDDDQQFISSGGTDGLTEPAPAPTPTPTPTPPTLTPTNSFRFDPHVTNKVEWVEEDDPGVFITINKFADGTRHIRSIRFSQQQFGTEDANNWWLENKRRVEAQYL